MSNYKSVIIFVNGTKITKMAKHVPKFVCHCPKWHVSNYAAGTALKLSYSQSARRSCLCLLWPWPLTFWSQNLINTSMNHSTSATKLGCNSFKWFLRQGVHKVLKCTDTNTDSLTHSQTRLQNAYGIVFQRRRRYNRNNSTNICRRT